MASITIPTPIQTTCRTVATHILNGDTASIQSLLGDTDFTCSDHCLKYKGLPIFTNLYYGGSEQSNYLMYAADRGHAGNGNNSTLTNYFGDGSDPAYFYMFNTFIVILSMVTIDTISSSTRNVCIIDKTNVEAFDAFTNYGRSSVSGILGIMFNYLDNSTPIYDKYYPNDVGATTQAYRNCNIRRASVTECTYAPLCGYTGTQASRVVMFTDFPNGSSNSVIHVGNKYFYILPIDETVIDFTRYDYDGTAAYTEQQETYCTLGIDVTSEVS